MERAVVGRAERHGPLVAHLAAYGPGMGKAKMMCMARGAPAHQAGGAYDAGRVFGVSYTALGRARIFCKTTRGKAPFPVFSLSPVLIKPHYNRSGGIGGPGGGRRGQPETRPKQG